MASKTLFHPASSLSTFPSAPLLTNCSGCHTHSYPMVFPPALSSPLVAELAAPLSSLLNCHFLGEVFIADSIQWRPCPCPFGTSLSASFTTLFSLLFLFLFVHSVLSVFLTQTSAAGTLPILLIILIPASSTVTSSVSVKSIKQSINQNSMN